MAQTKYLVTGVEDGFDAFDDYGHSYYFEPTIIEAEDRVKPARPIFNIFSSGIFTSLIFIS